MTARKRELKPDPLGRFRPRVGWELLLVGGRVVGKRQPRFNLGTDRKEAERRYAKIQELYDDNCKVNGEDVWSPRALDFAREIAKGKKVIQYPPLSEKAGYEDAVLEYAEMIEIDRKRFPSLQFEPADKNLYAESVNRNDGLIAGRLKGIEREMTELGALLGKNSIPARLIPGSFFEALDAYSEHIRRDGEKLENGDLKPYQRLRLHRIERYKREHVDLPLYALTFDKCSEMVAFWRNRRATLRGTKSSRDNARHHLSELFRFFRWLDATDQYQWAMPKGLLYLSRRIPKLDGEKKLSAVTKETYSPEQLAFLSKHATPLERLALYVGLNCAMGAAELGRIRVEGDVVLEQAHPFPIQIGFTSTNEDSFVRYFRPKTDVFGEWLLWPEVVPMVRWGIDRAKRNGTDFLFAWDTGKPMYDESLANPQASFANLWNRLLARARKSEKGFPLLPFGTLRDTVPNVLRRDFDGELASLCVGHGSPCKADSLLECYANKPFGRLHNAMRRVREIFLPIFAAVRDPYAETKHYLPVVVKEKVHAMIAEGSGVTEIARECRVSTTTVYREQKAITEPGRNGRGCDVPPGHDGPAVYQWRLVKKRKPVPIPRLLSTDKEGILVVGCTEDMDNRFGQGEAALKSGKGSSPLNLLYYLERFTGLPRRFPGFGYEYRFVKLPSAEEAERVESRLIKRYVCRFAEPIQRNRDRP